MTLGMLIASLKKDGVLKSSEIERALRKADRATFVPDVYTQEAYKDAALPIGSAATISQPYTVVFMLELLRARAGDHVMDVGSGSGWQTALLADLVGTHGRVYAIEIVPELCIMQRDNLSHFPDLQARTRFFCQNAYGGLPDVAHEIGGFDGIIVAAQVRDVPLPWRQQLKTGGRLIYPKLSAIFKETKNADGSFETERYPGFAFVPFVED